MASEGALNPIVIKKTQDTLGKLIKKPALTEKLLKKPPFRFLHDIIKSIIKETGYFEDLYTKIELDSENVKDRDSKMQFLQKLIDVLKIVTNQEVTARPSKIVAGHEPEKTNELLQLIAFVISKKMDCKNAIEIVKNGGQKQIPKEKKENLNPTAEKPTKTKTTVEKNKKVTTNKKEVKGRSPPKTLEKKTEKIKKPLKGYHSDKSKKDVVKEIPIESEKLKEDIELTENFPKQTNSVGSNETENSTSVVDKENKVNLPQTEQIELNNEIESTTVENVENERRSSGKNLEKERRSLEKNVENEKRSASKRRKSSASIKSGSENIQMKTEEKQDSSLTISQVEDVKSMSSSATTNSEKNQSSDARKQSTFVRENSNEVSNRPRTSLRPPSVRPASARPGAPRRRDKNVEIILQPNDSVKMAGISVKVESINSELEDDGENLIIIENTTMKDNEIDNKPREGDDDGVMEQKGHLVQQILETQKELIQGDEEHKKTEFDISTIQNRQSSAKQMDSLRDIIQNLTRSINPLGKLMDFIPEDIDSMQLELSMWRESYANAASELRKENSYTESALEPMKNQLSQINASIKEHNEMIDSSHSKILQNTEKIYKLLTD